MNLIVNAAADWAIGKGNELLFHISADMKQFKAHTVGNVVVMGRKTLDSLPGGRALPNRTNIVLTSNRDFSRENVIVCHSMQELLKELEKYDSDSIYIIGGSSLYSAMLEKCGTAYVTKVSASVPDADVFMVDLDEAPGWSVAEESAPLSENGIEFRFVTYKKGI